MSNIEFTVRKVFPGSEKQKAVGIHATFNMTIDVEDGILVSFNDMKLCQRKDGQWYVQSPYRKYKTNDKETGKEVERTIQFSKIWPEEKNWGKQDAIAEAVKRELEKAITGASSRDSKPPTTAQSTNAGAGTAEAW